MDWRPALTAEETLHEFLHGLCDGLGGGTAPLARDEHRVHEIATRVGRRLWPQLVSLSPEGARRSARFVPVTGGSE
ncbi:MAG TPA: hypothetical protein VG674_06230 [Amycolatopsis sp.]|nr:hypothetical protein [Amycolatopsis sp.]